MAKRRRLIEEYDFEDVNNEFYENCQEDRDRAKKLFALIAEQLERGAVSIEEGGAVALKAIEVMQKSNEQLMKLSLAINKKPVEENFDPKLFLTQMQSEDEAQELTVETV